MEPVRLPILTYHRVGDFSLDLRPRGNFVRTRDFARQMRALSLLGRRTLRFAELMACLRGERSPGRGVFLTFDDGYADTLENAVPHLAAHGFSAMIFVLSGLAGRTNEWEEAGGVPVAPLLSWDQICEARQAGMEIGSHGIAHRLLGRLEPAELHRELAQSKAEIEGRIGQAVECFCYPFGKFNAAVEAAVGRAGYAAACSVTRGRRQRWEERYRLRRIPVSLRDGVAGLLYRLALQRERPHRV